MKDYYKDHEFENGFNTSLISFATYLAGPVFHPFFCPHTASRSSSSTRLGHMSVSCQSGFGTAFVLISAK